MIEIALPNFLAKVSLGILAEFALSTLRHVQRDDGVTLMNGSHTIKTTSDSVN